MTWTQQAQVRQQTIGSITNDQGKKIPRALVLPLVGYLDSLSLDTQLAFQFGTAAASSADAFAPYNGNMQRITIFVNSIGNLFDCSGFMTGIITAINDSYVYGNSVAQGLPAVFATAAGAGTSAKTNIWVHKLPIGLALRNAPWHIGLFQTALQNLSIRLIVSW